MLPKPVIVPVSMTGAPGAEGGSRSDEDGWDYLVHDAHLIEMTVWFVGGLSGPGPASAAILSETRRAFAVRPYMRHDVSYKARCRRLAPISCDITAKACAS